MSDDALLRPALLSVGVGLLATAGLIIMGIMAMLMKAPAAAGGNYDATVLAETSLTHFYKMNEAAGAASCLDSKGTLNLTVDSSVTCGAAALLSDGETSYSFPGTAGASANGVSTATPWFTTAPFSVELWHRTPATFDSGANYYLFDCGTQFTNGVLLQVDATPTLNVRFPNGANHATSLTPAVNTLYHLVVTYDGTTATVYANGSQVYSAAATLVTPTGGAQIGNINTPFGSNEAKGRIAKFATYDAALTSTQVSTHYAAR